MPFTDVLLPLLLLPPLVACVAAILVPARGSAAGADADASPGSGASAGRAVGWAGIVMNATSFAASLALCGRVISQDAPITANNGFWRVDALSALLATCIAGVMLLASAFGPGLAGVDEQPARTRRFRIFVHAFALTMLVAVTTNNVGFMWVTIEATTITSAVIIPLTRTRASVEASWKYLLICSVGIALAFAGTVLAYFDFVSTAGHLPDALNWTVLRGAAPSLHRELMQLAFAFLLVGYGTKAGLAPMHTWLPDAHSEAPAPLSAMMSGVLLAVALYAIVRWKAVVDATLGSPFAPNMLLAAGVLSLAVGTLSLVVQRHYKRMLAYSSVEHVGLISIGLGLGPLGIFAAFLHLINHAAAKSMTFLLAGRVLQRYRTTEIAGVTGLLRAMPSTGGFFAIGILALVGLPPFGLFVSEFLLVRAAVVAGRPWIAAFVLAMILIAFVSVVSHLNRMLYGEVPAGVPIGETRGLRVLALGACVAVLIVLGVVLPGPVTALLDRTVTVIVR